MTTNSVPLAALPPLHEVGAAFAQMLSRHMRKKDAPKPPLPTLRLRLACTLADTFGNEECERHGLDPSGVEVTFALTSFNVRDDAYSVCIFGRVMINEVHYVMAKFEHHESANGSCGTLALLGQIQKVKFS